MTGFLRAAALLLILSVVFSECRTQSDRPQRRSGPIRSVPVAADIKRDRDFDCPEEFGYYPHPTDCTQYYVCVFGGALLESCTGGLMYSHELQTCDWPRNVGCDAIPDGGDEIERVVEKKPSPTLPPRRFAAAVPPPPPRAQPQPQPNPVVTSRGQPKITREELYEKQQQLYAEVDDLPPVEEIESDRQQRVYRGQPSTIGQVQRDRDGYAQIPSSGRTLNSNIIPASIPQSNVKIGSFSFGTQVDERRPTATQATQTYRAFNLTDPQKDRQSDIDTNTIEITPTKVLSRNKREVFETTTVGKNIEDIITTEKEIKANITHDNKILNRNDGDLVDYTDDADIEIIEDEDEESNDEIERGKRQIKHGRHYYKNTYKSPGKNWGSVKPSQFDISHYNFHVPTDIQPSMKGQVYNSVHNNFFDGTRKPNNDNLYSTANPFISYQGTQQVNQHKPFRASLPDPSNQKQAYNPVNAATQIITKSPPISSLPNSDNPFASLSGGFFNNHPYHSSNQNQNQHSGIFGFHSNIPQNNQNSFIDSSLGSSTIVTGRPVLSQSPRPQNKYRANYSHTNINHSPNSQGDQNGQYHQQPTKKPTSNRDYDDQNEGNREENDSSDESPENGDDDNFRHEFPEPPYEFTHPSHKFAEIKNPFADPNFDFDEFLNKLSGRTFKTSSSTPKYLKNSVSQNHNSQVEGSSQKYPKNSALKNHNSQVEGSSPSPKQQGFRSSTLNYHGMSTPRPFSIPTSGTISWQDHNVDVQTTTKQPLQFEQIIQRPQQQEQDSSYRQHKQQQQQTIRNEHVYNRPQGTAGAVQEAPRLKLKPPNFQDDRQLPINYNFNQALQVTTRPHFANSQFKGEPGNKQQHFSVTPKPYFLVTGTSSPIIFSTPKQQYLVTGKPYLVSSAKPQNAFFAFKHSTAKPLTTIANEHLTALQNFWNSPSQRPDINSRPNRPSEVTELPKLENLFAKPTSQSRVPEVTETLLNQYLASKAPASSTTARPSTRKPIPKPSPEMPDYYYDEDEQYYYEPPVKSQYMPSTEVRPQRPPMAQNYEEYEDNESYEDESIATNTRKPHQPKGPSSYNSFKTDTATKNHNDVSIATKAPQKDNTKNNFKQNYMAIMMNSVSPKPTVLVRPDVKNYESHHQNHRNRTTFMKKPTESGPYTIKPPKYLNQTTLRPYTVRHRLAKPTTVKGLPTPQPTQETKSTRGRTRHPNIVTQMRVTMTTPRDSHNQETRFTKTKHDDRTNSLEPTESVTPTSYSASLRPKMIYNGSQSYQPDQYDPYYAVYDEDGELYKDNDYVQQYNLASIRPAVQQTYRGTPPPPKRPVETFTARPVSPDDYDDALIQGQIVENNQNQYQQGIRHSTRGEGNELGFELPSSGRTTQYAATSLSTTPSTTSSTSTTTTTTQRPTTVAPITEAMNPTPYTPRSSTNEKPVPSSPNLINNATPSSIPVTTPTTVNFSSLAKPFENTENLHRLRDTSTQRLPNLRLTSHKNINSGSVSDSQENKKIVSLTTGFSIRRSKNNTNNPYTLTVITRPFEEYGKGREIRNKSYIKETAPHRYYYDNDSSSKDSKEQNQDVAFGKSSLRRSSQELISQEEPILIKPTAKLRVIEPLHKTSTVPTTTATKYILKTVIKRPVPFSLNIDNIAGSTENAIDTDALIEKALQNSRFNDNPNNDDSPKWDLYDQSEESSEEPRIKHLSNINSHEDFIVDTTTSSSSTRYTTVQPKEGYQDRYRSQRTTSKPSYYTYRLVEDNNDHTTEVFSNKAKSLLKAFISNFVTTTKPKVVPINIVSTTVRTTTEAEQVVNIGFKKRYYKYVDNKPYKSNFPRLQIITEPTINEYIHPSEELPGQTESEFRFNISTSTSSPAISANGETTPTMLESTTNTQIHRIPSEMRDSRFGALVTSTSTDTQNSQKSFKYGTEESKKEINNFSDNKEDNELTKLTNYKTEYESDIVRGGLPNRFTSTTTSAIKSTSTNRPLEPTTPTKSLSFPTRASRVNPAIKLAATNPGGGRRSYQSPTKCTDNGLQDNPKCNEIKYQRPSLTRGRGSAHYSTLSGSDPQPPQQTVNRGTPPTRSRPTLKPSTAIVSKSLEFVDIYANPPRRPSAVYPQPTPDKTAAKCRKDVCLLPDCSCGGKDIPGNIPVNEVPQIVLMTFDDAVNEQNEPYYKEIFERGRVNPNGCPISATFYVSHEWTDYRLAQNLYSDGHELASHTISHSFGEQFSQKKWNREVGGQREILAAYGGVKLEDVRGMRAPFLSVGGNKMFKMLYDSNFTYDSSMPVYENRPPSWPYTLDYKLFHDCMIPPCPTKSYPGVWEVPMVMWQDLNGGRCSMGDACANPPNAEGVYKMLLKNFDRHYTTNRAPFGLFYHAAWFTQPHHKEGFIMFLDFINQMNDVWIVTNWQALQWVRDPTPINRINNFQPFQCDYADRPKKCNNPKICNLWHKSGVRYMRTCQPCPEVYPWTGKTGIRSSRIDNDIEE